MDEKVPSSQQTREATPLVDLSRALKSTRCALFAFHVPCRSSSSPIENFGGNGNANCDDFLTLCRDQSLYCSIASSPISHYSKKNSLFLCVVVRLLLFCMPLLPLLFFCSQQDDVWHSQTSCEARIAANRPSGCRPSESETRITKLQESSEKGEYESSFWRRRGRRLAGSLSSSFFEAEANIGSRSRGDDRWW